VFAILDFPDDPPVVYLEHSLATLPERPRGNRALRGSVRPPSDTGVARAGLTSAAGESSLHGRNHPSSTWTPGLPRNPATPLPTAKAVGRWLKRPSQSRVRLPRL